MLIKKSSFVPLESAVMCNANTEKPFTARMANHNGKGSYLCRCCGSALFRAQDQFDSNTGWPSFDTSLPHAVAHINDQDGLRVEIVCAFCNSHLGHFFENEGFTPKSARYCINSVCLDYVSDNEVMITEEAILAGGCFWGVEYLFKKLHGVIKTETGYIGGSVNYPSYDIVCTGKSGHYEALIVIYNPKLITYESIIKFFFEIHDFTQKDGQGPDKGPQYNSAIFYYNEIQKNTALKIIDLLNERFNKKCETTTLPITVFWPAEKYHQDYYNIQGKEPYCHFYNKIF